MRIGALAEGRGRIGKMIKARRHRSYLRLMERIGSTDDFSEFEEWGNGPWALEIARKLPERILRAGPPSGRMDTHTRLVIDLEMARRSQFQVSALTIGISILALIVSVISLFVGH